MVSSNFNTMLPCDKWSHTGIESQHRIVTTTNTTVSRPLDFVRDYSDKPDQKGKMRKIKPIWIYCSKRQ